MAAGSEPCGGCSGWRELSGLNPRDMDNNSRLCRLLETRFPNAISFNGSTTFQNMVLRLEPSSADPMTTALAQVTLMDPPRPVASLNLCDARLVGLDAERYHSHLFRGCCVFDFYVVDCCDCRCSILVVY